MGSKFPSDLRLRRIGMNFDHIFQAWKSSGFCRNSGSRIQKVRPWFRKSRFPNSSPFSCLQTVTAGLNDKHTSDTCLSAQSRWVAWKHVRRSLKSAGHHTNPGLGIIIIFVCYTYKSIYMVGFVWLNDNKKSRDNNNDSIHLLRTTLMVWIIIRNTSFK